VGGGGSDTACRGSGSTGGVKGSGTGAGASAVDGSVATVARIVGWAFAGWGTALYWWAAALYTFQTRQLIKGVNHPQ